MEMEQETETVIWCGSTGFMVRADGSDLEDVVPAGLLDQARQALAETVGSENTD